MGGAQVSADGCGKETSTLGLSGFGGDRQRPVPQGPTPEPLCPAQGPLKARTDALQCYPAPSRTLSRAEPDWQGSVLMEVSPSSLPTTFSLAHISHPKGEAHTHTTNV